MPNQPNDAPLAEMGPSDQADHHVVIVGGGAAGLELATQLGDRLHRSGAGRVTLLDRTRTHLWKPLLHSVAAGSMDPSEHELNYLAQAYWHHFRYRFGEMVGLDRTRKLVAMAPTYDDEGREITPARSVRYDTLVIAIGSVTNDFGTKGAAEYAVPLETAEQARRFNRRLVNACLRAQNQHAPVRPGQLHVAVIGAGATGTELAAELHRTAREIVAFGLDRIDPAADIRIILVEARPAHPAGAARADFGGYASASGQARDRGARRRARGGGDGGRDPAGGRHGHRVGTRGLGSRGEGAGRAEGSGRAGDQPHQSTGRDADAANHARPGRLRDGRLRGLSAARLRHARAAAGAGGAPGGEPSAQAALPPP
ncbi:MAG: FAD-dependent oxidoreductase [Acetobacteraceae bacterium]